MSASGRNVLLFGVEPTLAGALAAAMGRRGHRVEVAWDFDELATRAFPEVLVTTSENEQPALFARFDEWQRDGSPPRVLLIVDELDAAAHRVLSRLGGGSLLAKPVRIPELMEAVELDLDPLLASACWRRPSIPDPVAWVARDLLSFCTAFGVPPAARARIVGAASELVENAAMHAHLDETAEIELRAEISPHSLWLTVEDRGLGFHPPPRLPRSGGLARAAALCESFQMESEPRAGTLARLRFDLLPLGLEGGPLRDLSDHDFLAPQEAKELLAEIERDPRGSSFVLPPALAVVVGRLLAGAEPEVLLSGSRCASAES